jgi:hypothetical protein
VPYLDHDRVLEPEIRTAIELIRSGALAAVAPPPLAGEGRVGAL